MTHDPYQTYQTVGAYSGLMNPFSSPFGGMQQTSANNPLAAAFGASPGVPATFGQPFAPQGYQGFSGIPNYGGISPQQLQLASALASQYAQINAQSPFNNPWQNAFSGGFQHPFANAGLQNPILQNPILQNALLQNPWQVAAQQNPQMNPQLNPIFNPVLAHLAATLGPQFGQQSYSPYAQQQPYQQTGYGQTQLAPQSWVGQGLASQGFAGQGQGQIHPLILQALARTVQNQGIAPWGAF